MLLCAKLQSIFSTKVSEPIKKPIKTIGMDFTQRKHVMVGFDMLC